MSVYFTPVGANVFASKTSGLRFPALSQWTPADIKVARSGELKPANFGELVDRYNAGEEVNLAEGGQIRIGCSFALKVFVNGSTEGKYLFSKFSDTHPTQANKITPPGGVFDRPDETPQEAAFRELCEEIIFAFASHKVTRMPIMNNVCHTEHMFKFGERNSFEFSPVHGFTVKAVNPPGATKVSFGSGLNYNAGVTFEKGPGSVELIWFGEAHLNNSGDLTGASFYDGELFPNGEARNSIVVCENYDNYPQTEKAQLVLEIG